MWLLYSSEEGKVTVNVYFANVNFRLTQRVIGELFSVNVSAISKHQRKIYVSGELSLDSTISKMETVQKEGTRNIKLKVDFYYLDAIIAGGYRFNSKQAMQFRIWATNTLKEYIIEGFVLNDEMLKNGKPLHPLKYTNTFI